MQLFYDLDRQISTVAPYHQPNGAQDLHENLYWRCRFSTQNKLTHLVVWLKVHVYTTQFILNRVNMSISEGEVEGDWLG